MANGFCQFTIFIGIVLVISANYIHDQWSIETAPAYDGAVLMPEGYTVWSNTAAIGDVAVNGRAWQQISGQYTDDDGSTGDLAYNSTLETGDIRQSGKVGWQRVCSVDVLGKLQAQATLQIAVAMNGSDSFEDYASVTHYAKNDILSGYSLLGATFDADSGVLTEDTSSGVHRITKSTSMSTAVNVYSRAVIGSIASGRAVGMGGSAGAVCMVIIDSTGLRSTLDPIGTLVSADVTDLGGGRFLVELVQEITGSSPTFSIQGLVESGGSFATTYTGDSRDICTIDSYYAGNDPWHDGSLRQTFAPRRQKCEGLRVRIRDSSTTQGAELTALRLEIKPKRGPGRLRAGLRS